MSLQKTASQALSYELTGAKKINGKSAAVKYAQQLSSSRLAWILVSRHKVGLLALGNVVLILNFVMPEWPEFVKSLF